MVDVIIELGLSTKTSTKSNQRWCFRQKNHTGVLHGREDHASRKNIFIQWFIKSYIFHLNPEVDAVFQRSRFNPVKDEVWFQKNQAMEVFHSTSSPPC